MDIDRRALEEWQKGQPLAVLQLDPSDRVVLRVAGKTERIFISLSITILDFLSSSRGFTHLTKNSHV